MTTYTTLLYNPPDIKAIQDKAARGRRDDTTGDETQTMTGREPEAKTSTSLEEPPGDEREHEHEQDTDGRVEQNRRTTGRRTHSRDKSRLGRAVARHGLRGRLGHVWGARRGEGLCDERSVRVWPGRLGCNKWDVAADGDSLLDRLRLELGDGLGGLRG